MSGGLTPLWCAICNNHDSIIQLLVQVGADIAAEGEIGEIVFEWAMRREDGSIVSLPH